jgi:AcrR family transcriptional regulator
MSPRPRKVSDDEVFAAAHRATMRLGPGELTLAEIAAEAGVTAGALAQRFGSKRGLLLALAERAAASAGDSIRALQAAHRSPLAAVRAYAECMAQLAQSPAALARNLAYLQVDLADPEFRAHLAVQARATRAGLHELLKAAVAAGELVRGTDTRALARTVEVVLSGSLLTWAFYHDGTAARWIRADVDAVLAPYLGTRRRHPRQTRTDRRSD